MAVAGRRVSRKGLKTSTAVSAKAGKVIVGKEVGLVGRRTSSRIAGLKIENEVIIISDFTTKIVKNELKSKPIGKGKTKKAPVPKGKKPPPLKKTKPIIPLENKTKHFTLPRTRELDLLTSKSSTNKTIMGCDEAGRGPLAGPVVIGCCSFDYDPKTHLPTGGIIEGICDSKEIKCETERDRLYEELISTKGIRWSVAVVDAQRIDEINILQASMEGMRMASNFVMTGSAEKVADSIAVEIEGCYVVGNCNTKDIKPLIPSECYALVDGNRFPSFRETDSPKITTLPKIDMLCEGEAMVKGDGREYIIGCASILAKVSRDRLMREYDKLYPEFNLKQHKGYPTKDHMSAVFKVRLMSINRVFDF